ncbi:MAG: chorismate mutase [Actinobacteria bacterium]|nr:chorismate mutase [Actinomycetota bacterium]
MSRHLRAIRGATTVDDDTVEAIDAAVVELLTEVFERNHIDTDDLVSILFTATDDIHAKFPATSARLVGLGDVPLICARELDVEGATARCVRVMIHLETELDRDELRHVYLKGASGLRDDLRA